MKNPIGITLGMMTALGGFVDLGQIVFTIQAGALFSYRLLWAILLGSIATFVYMEMCGRVAVVAREPVFATVRDRLAMPLGMATLVASNLLNLLTCAAELGGPAIVIHVLTGWPERAALLGVGLLLPLFVYVSKFQWIERTFGLSGLLMIVFPISAVVLHPDWKAVAGGLNPFAHFTGHRETLLYAYFAVGIFSAMLMEYQVHFYSSGAIEEDWKIKDLTDNFLAVSLGSILGSLVTVTLLALGALLFAPDHIFPEQLSSVLRRCDWPDGQKMLVLACLVRRPASVVQQPKRVCREPTTLANFSTGRGERTYLLNRQRVSPLRGSECSRSRLSPCLRDYNHYSWSTFPSFSGW